MSDWYEYTSGEPDDTANAGNLRTEFLAVQTGFSDKLPSLTGKANGPVLVNSAGTALEAFDLDSGRAALGIYQPTRVSKPGDTSRTSTTKSADPHLTAELAAGATYDIEFVGILSSASSASGKIQVAFGGTSALASALSVSQDSNAGANVFSTDAADTSFYVPNPGRTYVMVRGTITTTSAGTLSIDWASAAGTQITMEAYSWLSYRKVS